MFAKKAASPGQKRDLEAPLVPGSPYKVIPGDGGSPRRPESPSRNANRVLRPLKTKSGLLRKATEREEHTKEHDAAVRMSDIYRWIVLILTSFLSAALSFGIDTFTQYFGIWRAKLTGASGPILMVCGVNVAALLLARMINRTTIESEGSGFPEMKAMLFGKVMLNFLTLRALACKAASLALGVGAGLPLGKEGPNVHMAACISRALAPDFYDEKDTSPLTGQGRHVKNTKVKYLLLAATSVAVGSSFAAPIGGVIFSLELMLPQIYDTVAYWGCFVSSVAGSLCYTVLRTATSNAQTLEPLMTTNLLPGEGATSARPVTRLLVDLFLGALCGLHGGFWIKAHAKVGGCMKRWRSKQDCFTQMGSRAEQAAADLPDSPRRKGSLQTSQFNLKGVKTNWFKVCIQWRDLFQCCLVVILNTVLAAHLPLLHGKPQPMLMSDLFDKDLSTSRQAEWGVDFIGPLGNMFLCYLMKTVMTILALTLPISAGVVAPVMIIGALLGRVYGMLLPDALKDFLLSTPGGEGLITEQDRANLLARFAIVGAAAHATAVTRAFAMAITVYEVLTLPSSLLPLCSSCLAAIFVSNKVSLPFFDMNLTGRGLGGISALTHTDHAEKSAVSIMRDLDQDSEVLFETVTVDEIRSVLANTDEEGAHHFPIVKNVQCPWAVDGIAPMLKGSISRESLKVVSERFPNPQQEISLLDPQFTVARDDSTSPLVCVNPETVTHEQFVKDVYILFKACETDVCYVIDGNILKGVIGWKEILGHRLDKPWFG